MSLYKYLDSSRICIIEEGLIRFTQPGAFNDPFEMQPFFQSLASEDYIEKQFFSEIDNTLKAEYEKQTPLFNNVIPHKFIQQFTSIKQKDMLDKLKQYSGEIVKILNQSILAEFDKKIGILSLTEKHNNILMWAHYAESHQGFIIEFDENHLFFTDKLPSRDASRQLRKIVYSHLRPNLTLIDVNNIDVLLTKSKDWEYEQEWRMILPLDECKKRISKKPYDICLFSFPSSVIKSIIMGCRMTLANKNKLRRIIKDISEYAHVKLFETHLEKDKYNIYIKEVTM